MHMRIGFIGAGKVGYSLGRYLKEHHISISGYYSRALQSAMDAAEFVETNFYTTLDELVKDSEVLFITVPDGVIKEVWEQLKTLQVTGKIICHCSGVLSSQIFSDIAEYQCYGYSIHPLLAISSKHNSFWELSNAIFTIEGDAGYLQDMKKMVKSCGNQVIEMKPQEKIRYHAAAVLSSNLVLALLETATEELMACGFSGDEAKNALLPLICGNVEHLKQQTIEEALTGPVERCDVTTVKSHLEKLDGENREIYRLLSKKACAIAKRKNGDQKNENRNYQEMEDILQ